MNKALAVVLFVVSFLVLVGSQNVFAVTETVFEEDFDGALVGWNQSVCNRNDPTNQICQIGQSTTLLDTPNDPPNSPPNWGFVEIFDADVNTGPGTAEIRYQKSFNVAQEDDYDVSSWLGIKDCSGCNIRTQLYIDGNLIFEQIGPSGGLNPLGPHKFFEQTIIHLTGGSHDVEIAMFSNLAFAGNFRASFDDIIIQREVPEQVIGGQLIPIETTSLLLAGAQSTTWMIPVVLSIVGIGLVFLRKRA